MRAIGDGGLTPSLPLVEAIAGATSLPLRVMLRENRGFETTPEEIDRMRGCALVLASMNIDGLVAGFARTGKLSLDEFDAVVNVAPRLPVTFHRAFDSLLDPESAIDVLKSRQIDRILTSGGDGSAEERCARLRRFVTRGGPRLTIIAGGGVDVEMFRLLVAQQTVREIHVGRAAREGQNAEGPVSATRVQRLRKMSEGIGPR